MLTKILLCPWFGELPSWFNRYEQHIKNLQPMGYDWLITTDLEDFAKRVKAKLDIECPIVPGTGKVHDFRPALGLLFEEEAKGYDYVGHSDFDCIYGNVAKFMPDSELRQWDIWSNHVDYISGPWTLYRNDPRIIHLFERHPRWREIMSNPESTGWAEFQDGFTGVVDKAHGAGEIKRLYTMWQTKDLNDFSTLRFENGTLTEGGVERMMAHWRRVKVWPEGVTH